MTEPTITIDAQMRDAAPAGNAGATAVWGGDTAYLSNEEALEQLRGRDSGVRPLTNKHAYRIVKRAFDIAASGAAIAVLLAPGAVLCAAICLKSPGASPIYSQWRVGRVNPDGAFSAFRMYKFRSMVPNADALLEDLQGANEASGPMFKMRDDPRVIPGIGSFIRRHSIDELPQLLNVLKGDMSLIGPRPGLPREVAVYDAHAMRRLAVKPGCGGPWQVSGRSDVGFDEMVDLDLGYIESRSLLGDAAIVVRTVAAMFTGKGAA